MSPKLRHSTPRNREGTFVISHEKIRINIEAIDYYLKNYDYQIKFVVRDEIDFLEIEEILSRIRSYDKMKILIMPLASSRKQLYNVQKNIVKLCVNKGYRYANRLQLQIWGIRSEC